MFEQNSSPDNHDNNHRSGTKRSGSRSPVRRSRTRSRSPREWKRTRHNDSPGHDRGNRGRREEKIRLYVSNIPYEVRWQDLKDIFKQQCPDGITYVEMYEGPDGKTCGAGVVEVRGRELADKAIEAMHRYEYKGRQIVVREEREKDRIRHMKEAGGGGGPGIMGGGGSGMGGGGMGGGGMGSGMGGGGMGGGGIGGGMGGGMSSGMGGGGMGGGMSSGMGGTGNITVGNLNLNLSLLNTLGIDPANITDQVFVANLDYKVSARKLKDIFKMAGVIISADIKMDKEGKSRGMGIVKFDHPMEAVQAVSMFNGQILYDRTMSVRMDKMPDTSTIQPQQISNRLPQGLKSINMGLGINGAPLQDIGRIANCLAISTLQNIVSGAGTGNSGGMNMGMSNTMNNMGIGMGNNNAMDNMGGGMGGMGNMGAMGNMGSGMANMGMGMGNNLMGNMGNNNMGGGMGGNSMGMGNMNNMGNSNMGGGMGVSTMGMGSSSGMNSSMNLMSNQLSSLGVDRSSNLSISQLGGMSDSMGSLSNSILGNSNMGASSMGGRSNRLSLQQETTSIIVRNLPFSFTWQNLKEKFQDCGDVRYTEIKTENGKSKGWGTVRFMSPEDARRAVNLMNGARLEGRMIDVRLDK